MLISLAVMPDCSQAISSRHVTSPSWSSHPSSSLVMSYQEAPPPPEPSSSLVTSYHEAGDMAGQQWSGVNREMNKVGATLRDADRKGFTWRSRKHDYVLNTCLSMYRNKVVTSEAVKHHVMGWNPVVLI